jgi:hypothetical protein
MQYQIDGKVTAQIVDSDPPGKIIAELNGNKSENSRAVSALISNAKRAYLPKILYSKDETMLFKKVTSFVSLLNTEVSKYNSGKDTGKKKSKGAKIVIRPETKKAGVVQQIKTILRDNKKILTRGYKVKPGKIREKSLSGINNLPKLGREEIMKKLDAELKHLNFSENQVILIRKILKTNQENKVKFETFQVINIKNNLQHYKNLISIHKANIRTYKKLLK